MKKPMNKDLKAILLCGAATLMGIISIFTTDASIMRGFYGLLSIIFLVGVIISTKNILKTRKSMKLMMKK